MPTSEDRFLARLFAQLPIPGSEVIVGPGDDAAVVVPSNGALVSTTDALVEGVHFDWKFCTPFEVGVRSIEINFSDLAAQGAQPKYVLMSLVVPSSLSEEELLEFNKGVLTALADNSAQLIGGNLSQTRGPFVASVTAMGEPFPDVSPYQTPRRGGCQVGDWLAITGPLGLAAAGLAALQTYGRSHAQDLFPMSVKRYLTPKARVESSRKLLTTGAVTSMMDISDGLSLDMTRLRGKQKLDVFFNKEALYPHPEISSLLMQPQLAASGLTSMDLMLHRGDDYELLLSLNPERWMQAVSKDLALKDLVHIVGELEDIKGNTPELWLRSPSTPDTLILPQGWDHLP